MTYQVALLVFGILLLLVGLVGKIKAKELEVGTSNITARIVIALMGAIFVALSFNPDWVSDLLPSEEESPPPESASPVEKFLGWRVGAATMERSIQNMEKACEELKGDWFQTADGFLCQRSAQLTAVSVVNGNTTQLRGRYTDLLVFDREKKRLVKAFGDPLRAVGPANAYGWQLDDDHYIRLELLPNGETYLLLSTVVSAKGADAVPPPEFRPDVPTPAAP